MSFMRKDEPFNLAAISRGIAMNRMNAMVGGFNFEADGSYWHAKRWKCFVQSDDKILVTYFSCFDDLVSINNSPDIN